MMAVVREIMSALLDGKTPPPVLHELLIIPCVRCFHDFLLL
jgi:hypothetical protein